MDDGSQISANRRCFGGWALFAVLFFGQQVNAMAACTIDIHAEQSPGRIVISGRCSCAEAKEIRYELAVEKSGKSGTSATRQGGMEKLQAGQESSFGSATFSTRSGDQITVQLDIKAGEVVLGSRTKTIAIP